MLDSKYLKKVILAYFLCKSYFLGRAYITSILKKRVGAYFSIRFYFRVNMCIFKMLHVQIPFSIFLLFFSIKLSTKKVTNHISGMKICLSIVLIYIFSISCLKSLKIITEFQISIYFLMDDSVSSIPFTILSLKSLSGILTPTMFI